MGNSEDKSLSCHAFKLGMGSEQDARTTRISQFLTLWFKPKFLKYLGLAISVTLMTLLLNLPISPTVATVTQVETTAQTSPVIKSLNTNTSQLVHQGKNDYQRGQYAAAITIWKQALDTFTTQGDTLNQAMVLSNLALAYRQLGQWHEANQAIETSLTLLSTPNPNTSQNPLKILAQALNTQGHLQLAQGQAELALATWEQATKTYQQVGDKTGVTRSLINQTHAMRALGLYLRARNLLDQIRQTLAAQPDSLTKIAGLRSLGDLLRITGDLNQSRQILEQSLAIAKTLPSPPDSTAILFSLGNTARSQNQIEDAIQFYQQAAATTVSPTLQFQAQANQLSLFVETQQQQAARQLWTQLQPQLAQLPVSRQTLYAQINVARSLMQMSHDASGNVPEIAQLLATITQQARTLKDRQVEAYALGYLGQLYEQTQQLANAQTLTEQALTLAQSIKAPELAYRWQWQLGRLLKAQGNTQGAIAAYDQAVNTLQSLRTDLVAINDTVQFSFRESVEPVYREFVGLLLQPLPGEKEVSQAHLKQAREVIESLQLAELDNFFQEACLTSQPQQIDHIDPTAAVFYPIILPDRLEVILSLPGQPLRHYATQASSVQVEQIIHQMRQSLRPTSLKKERLPLAQNLYDWLIRPAETELAQSDITTLVFVLDGSLRNLPMAALYDGQHYLVETYSLAIAPSLHLLSPQPLIPGQLKVLTAGVSQSISGFSPLPAVEWELSQITNKVPALQLLNQDFTSVNLTDNLQTQPFSVVHLATHGQFSSDPEETFILAWDKKIKAKDFETLLRSTQVEPDYPIELLVLSACQTAIGDQRAALGLAGIATRSGARSTLATLWSVQDDSTAQLMVEFYKELNQGTLNKATALRHAQLSLLQQGYNHPYYWAPFILVGNWL
ncbi:tetratricopeptide repeat domain protein [Coleofasciculus chthonoplastes PCC 7420]|uniref:Tetratricopeptide repeat domain protein n=1 Tax=Coleofasciculus chthonoplastes PCC 7420 TaxID=118168 RepID=B4VY15_9CYAN|nr:CHAT domain-containing protein [Coleofasciculus chthonoplastes]EDX73156.1 tetratricopeptide repeat domain protein [Coleofasciculus chthonoplastes PCC 7420]